MASLLSSLFEREEYREQYLHASAGNQEKEKPDQIKSGDGVLVNNGLECLVFKEIQLRPL